MPSHKPLLEDYLLNHLDKGTYPGLLEWIDRDSGIFVISFKRLNSRGWTKDYTPHYVGWDLINKRQTYDSKVYYSKSRHNIISAMDKVPEKQLLFIEEIDDDDGLHIYQFPGKKNTTDGGTTLPTTLDNIDELMDASLDDACDEEIPPELHCTDTDESPDDTCILNAPSVLISAVIISGDHEQKLEMQNTELNLHDLINLAFPKRENRLICITEVQLKFENKEQIEVTIPVENVKMQEVPTLENVGLNDTSQHIPDMECQSSAAGYLTEFSANNQFNVFAVNTVGLIKDTASTPSGNALLAYNQSDMSDLSEMPEFEGCLSSHQSVM